MMVIEKDKATATFAAYTEEVGKGPVVVTDQGTPVAVLVAIENADLETVTLSTSHQFLKLIERSRAHAGAGISSEEMRRRLGEQPAK